MRPETIAIHAGSQADGLTGAIVPPIYQTSTYQQQGIGDNKGFIYTRTGNPSRSHLEESLAAIEGAEHALCFASGMAAINTVVQTLRSGDHVLCPASVYGGTFRLLSNVYDRFGIEVSFVDMADLEAVRAALKPNTAVLWMESPTNPLLGCCDIAELAVLARSKGILSVVDNTFATPIFQRPLELGVDLVVHSTTKYLGGHLDVLGGALLCNDEDIYGKLKYLQNAVGAVQAPFDAWLIQRGLKTVGLRVRQQGASAQSIAAWLEAHPQVARVHYPGLKSHPQHAIAAKQMSGYGGVLSFELKGTAADAERFVASTQLFALGESLGGVRSLACIPAKQTHASMTQEARDRAGIKDTLVRLSVGLEHPDDLIEDLQAALAAVCGVAAVAGC